MTYKRYSISCLLCKSELSTVQFDTHYKSKQCLSGGTPKFTKLNSCPHCLLKMDGSFDVGNHVRWCCKNPKNLKLHSDVVKTCTKCDKEFVVAYKSKRVTCSRECRYKQTEESKNSLSMKRIEYLNNNKDKHPWKRCGKFVSVPCENVKRYLTDHSYNFIEEFSPIEDRNFSIDIAFPDLKIGIEINGNQHYDKSGKLLKYYQERHDLIESIGWRLIEVHYSRCFKEESIQTIVDMIN